MEQSEAQHREEPFGRAFAANSLQPRSRSAPSQERRTASREMHAAYGRIESAQKDTFEATAEWRHKKGELICAWGVLGLETRTIVVKQRKYQRMKIESAQILDSEREREHRRTK